MPQEHILTKFLYIWLFFSLVLFTFIIPPFQKPDEINHFLRATTLAKGELHCINSTSGKAYFLIPHNFYDLPDQMSVNVIRFRYTDKFPLHALVNQQSTNNHNVKVADLCGLPFPGYLANLPGIFIGVIFNNPLLAFYLGRVSGGIFFLICLFFALKIVPKNYKVIIYLYAVIPMVIHQVTAISYDSIQLSLLLLIFSLFLKFLTLETITKLELATFLFLLALFAVAKSGYYFIALLFFAIPYKKFTNRFIIYILPTIIVCILAAAFVFLSARVILTPAPGNHFINPQAQIKYLMHSPNIAWHILFNTLQSYGDFYYESLIAYFGWIDFHVNYFVYAEYTVIFAGVIYVLIEKNKKPLINKKQLVLLFFIIIATSLIIFTSQYLSWSPVASPIIHGVQGRYFLVLFPISIFTIVEFALLMGKRKFYIVLGIGFLTFLMVNLIFNIYNRYYNYNGIYANEHPFKNTIKTLSTSSNKQLIPIEKKYTFTIVNMHTDKTIDGFNMVFEMSKKDISMPYEYTIRDAKCNHVLRHSFLDLNKLQDKTKPTVYEEKFTSPIEKGNDKLCITINPFSKTKDAGYINLISLNNNILFEPLYNK
ncbi:MAG TPA: DUF2142 domain-containing protein [Candidatus Saccharimonadales bacterium]|nr:DUF2142 domain-containing protein [Candidatus Saccharimonadales bacterium]